MCLAVPARVLAVSGDEAVVSAGGVSRTVSLLALGEAPREGDYLLVHAGFAIERLDPAEAERSLALFREIAAAEPPPPGDLPSPRPPRGDGKTGAA